MTETNHWPLGSRFVSPEDAAIQLAKSARPDDAFSMTKNTAVPRSTFDRLSTELRSNQPESVKRELRPIDWLGRP